MNTPTTPKKRSPICSACPTACATVCTIAQPMKEWKSEFANAWKKSNGLSNPPQVRRPVRQKSEQKENLRPDFRNTIGRGNRAPGGIFLVTPPHHSCLLLHLPSALIDPCQH